MKKLEHGRSMIEMLGVLAIIGVLSVGAIAGYQKAMTKYRLNKHAQGFNILLNNMIQHAPKLKGGGLVSGDDEYEHEYYGPLFDKLNLLPDGFKLSSSTDVYDNLHNRIWIYRYANIDWIGMGIDIKPESGKEICANIVRTAKENHADLRKINLQYNDNDDNLFKDVGALFGDKECGDDKKCLRDLKLADIDALCNACDLNMKKCTVYISTYAY